MIKQNEIINIKNFLNYEEFFNLKSLSNTIQWGFYGRSSSAMKEWHLNHPIYGGEKSPIKNFSQLHPGFQYILNKLSKQYNCLIHPYDIYFNAYRFGNEMDIHTDKVTKPGFNRTIIFYLTEDWLPQWHGETVFYDDKSEDVIKSVLPYPNSVVIFDSRIPHSSVPISKFCTENRIILVFQCEIETL
ncbi:Predicted proline hydroxylase (EGL-9) [uncultured Mediterranean phage uvMED]|nr:Predicted proline hydroxylase (EGL-9) [uncultured Mediterranean phage uvMED]